MRNLTRMSIAGLAALSLMGSLVATSEPAAAGSAVARRDPIRDKAARPAMVVLVMVFRIAVNSNPSGSNGAKSKKFLFLERSGRRPEIRKPLREALSA